MVSGLPLASRRMVCSSGRSKCVSSAGALQASCGGAASSGQAAGFAARPARRIAGVRHCRRRSGRRGRRGDRDELGLRQNAACAFARHLRLRRCALQQCALQKRGDDRGPLSRRSLFVCWHIIASFAFSWRRDVRIDDLRRQGPANAVMNTSRHIIFLCSGIEIEVAAVVPVTHDREPIEQQRAMLLATTRMTSA